MKLDNQFKQDLRKIGKVWQDSRKMGEKSEKVWEKWEKVWQNLRKVWTRRWAKVTKSDSKNKL